MGAYGAPLRNGPNYIDLDCGIACNRITAWLGDELGLTSQDGCWIYRDGQFSCEIQATPLEKRMLGAIGLERTHLTARGDAEALDSFQVSFTLRFMSAGG